MRDVDPAAPAPQPLALTGRTIVCLSSIDWNFLWQGHQEIMSRFAAAGNRVLFVENTGVRTVRFRDLPRILRRLRNWSADRTGERRPSNGITVVAPLLLPFPKSGLAARLNDHILLPRLARKLKELGAHDPIIFSFLPTPNAVRLVELLATPASVTVYYCIADFQELSDLGPVLERSEERLARMADLVFVQGAVFGRRLSIFNPRVHEFRFGVNLELFDRVQVPRGTSEIAALPRPIVGYTGGLHGHVDFGLLVEVARSIPHGSLVLVGPLVTEPGAALRAQENVHFLGSRPIAQLPRIVADFDVALVAYARTAYTETVFPTKLYEYLALGRPVVSTDLPEVVDLGLPRFAVRIAHESSEFTAAVLEAAAEDDTDAAAKRAALAQSRDWKVITAEMAKLISESAARKG